MGLRRVACAAPPMSKTALIPASADRPGDDPIFALNAEANARAQAGESIVNSTLGALMTDAGELAVMESVQAALQRVPASKASAYAPISGSPAYLVGVIRDLFGGTTLEAQAVAVATPGGTGACYTSIQNFLEPGDALLTSSYFWGPYRILATHARRRLETYQMFDEEGAYNTAGLRTSLLELVQEQGRALLFLNTPCHNPTGYSLDEADWKATTDALLEAAQLGHVTLLIDFAYGKFAGNDSWRDSVKVLVDAGLTVLFAWTASKGFAQYGARIGSCVALHCDEDERSRLRNALSFTCRATWSNCNHLGMLVIGELLANDELRQKSEDERAANVRLLDSRVEVFKHLAREAGLRFPRYEGGFFVAVFTPDAGITCKYASERGVYLVPLQGAVRIAICATSAADLPRLVGTLREAIEAATEATTQN